MIPRIKLFSICTCSSPRCQNITGSHLGNSTRPRRGGGSFFEHVTYIDETHELYRASFAWCACAVHDVLTRSMFATPLANLLRRIYICCKSMPRIETTFPSRLYTFPRCFVPQNGLTWPPLVLMRAPFIAGCFNILYRQLLKLQIIRAVSVNTWMDIHRHPPI